MAENNPTRESTQLDKVVNFVVCTLLIATFSFTILFEIFAVKAMVNATERKFFIPLLAGPLLIIGGLFPPMTTHDKIFRKKSSKYRYSILFTGIILGIVAFMGIIYPFVKDW